MFFSVKKAMRIGGKAFIPCICYEASKSIEENIEVLVSKGLAETYTNKVLFCNGHVMARKIETSGKKAKKIKK